MLEHVIPVLTNSAIPTYSTTFVQPESLTAFDQSEVGVCSKEEWSVILQKPHASSTFASMPTCSQQDGYAIPCQQQACHQNIR